MTVLRSEDWFKLIVVPVSIMVSIRFEKHSEYFVFRHWDFQNVMQREEKVVAVNPLFVLVLGEYFAAIKQIEIGSNREILLCFF